MKEKKDNKSLTECFIEHLFVCIGIIFVIILFLILSNLLINYNGYEYKYMGVWEQNKSFDDYTTECKEFCGELPPLSACPCNRCQCYCVKHEYFGLTRNHIRNMCKV